MLNFKLGFMIDAQMLQCEVPYCNQFIKTDYGTVIKGLREKKPTRR
jgi:hypothetical protein